MPDDTPTTLTLRPRTVERFEEMRAETKNEHVPEMAADLFLNALMDTAEAVDRGYYNQAKDQ